MRFSSIFGFKKPESTDNAVAYTDISTNADLAEKVSKNGIAIQTNTSTTAYVSDFPLASYVNGHSFVFIPTYTSTGVATVNFNNLGFKNIYDISGTRQFSSLDLQAYNSYLFIYDNAINGGVGGFKSVLLSNIITKKTGHVTYAESILAGGTLTKTIDVGVNKSRGVITTGSTANGVMIFFDTDPNNTKATGNCVYYGGYGDPFYRASAWSKRVLGSVTRGYSGYYYYEYYPGINVTGTNEIQINDVYLNGANLTIVFRNLDSSAPKTLNCTIDWEVW